jgi:hypothetical protein
LDFHKLGGLHKAIKHYGVGEFWQTVDILPDKDIIRQIVEMALKPEFKNTTLQLLDRNNA